MNYDIESKKREFIQLLRSTGREGVDDLLEYLDQGRIHFFTAPASVTPVELSFFTIFTIASLGQSIENLIAPPV